MRKNPNKKVLGISIGKLDHMQLLFLLELQKLALMIG